MLIAILEIAASQSPLISILKNGDTNVVKSNFGGNVTIWPHANGKTRVSVNIEGLNPGVSYGLHIHQACDATNCSKFNYHWDVNPGVANTNHGKWNAAKKHVGDLMSCDTDQTGNCQYSYYTDLNILGGAAPVTTTQGVVLHSAVDDFGLITSNPNSGITGNSGSRIGCGCFYKFTGTVQALLALVLLAIY